MSVVLPRSMHFCIGIIIAESNTLAWLLGAHRTRLDKDAGVVRRI